MASIAIEKDSLPPAIPLPPPRNRGAPIQDFRWAASWRRAALALGGLHDFAAVIIAAMGADAVRPLGLMAMGTGMHGRRPQLPVGAPLGAARA